MARKRGFCLDDSEPFMPGVDPRIWVYRGCGTLTTHGNQGVHVGWTDIYAPYLPDSTDACPVRDERNFCVLRESSYTDNMATPRISIPASRCTTGGLPEGRPPACTPLER